MKGESHHISSCAEVCGCGMPCTEGAPGNHRVFNGEILHTCSMHFPRREMQGCGPVLDAASHEWSGAGSVIACGRCGLKLDLTEALENVARST